MSLIYSLQPESTKPFLNYKPEVVTDLQLCSGRRDTAAFELVVFSPKKGASLTLGTSAALSQLGQVDAARVACRSELPVKMNLMAFHPVDSGDPVADALLEDERVDIAPDTCGAVYVEVTVPEDTEPGTYTVSLDIFESRMFTDEKKVGTYTAALTVYAYTLPTRLDLDFHLDIWQHNTGLARVFGVPLWSDEHFALIEKAVASLASLGQKAVTLILSDAPWSGQWCHLNNKTSATLYEYSIIPVSREENGSFTLDFSVMQRYIDLCAKYGIDREITLFGLVNVWCDSDNGFGAVIEDAECGAKIRYFDKKDGSYKYMRSGKDFDFYVSAIYEYFRTTGQLEKVRLMADEPADVQAYRRAIDHIKEIAPGFKLKAALNHAEFIPEFGDRVFDYAPNLRSWSAEFEKITEYKRTMPGKRFLWYVCNQPAHPNTFLTSELCETLFIGVITSMMGMDGFLRWGFTVWCDEPVKDNRYLTWPCGDLHFVYPSRSGGILPSLRSKMLGRAIDLCGILNELKARCGADAAQTAYDKIVKEKDVRRFFDGEEPIAAKEMYSSEYSDYDSMRAYALSMLS